MNIAFISTTISGINTGKGGHYYSLLHTAIQLSDKGNKVILINIGNKTNGVLQTKKLSNHHIHFNGLNLLKVFSRLKNIFNDEDIHLIHCFDKPAIFWGGYLSNAMNINLIATKCGGPITKWYPKVSQIIVFSEEDYNHFLKKPYRKKQNTTLIPNRVIPFKSDNQRIQDLRTEYKINKDSNVVLRIARICNQNLKSILQTINLVIELNNKGIKVQFLIIGHLEDKNVLKRIEGFGSYGKIITEDKYTINSKEIIPLAKFVIGSGRSLMEAANFGVPLLVPNDNLDIPVLLNKTNFYYAFSKNFSYRTSFDNVQREESLNSIIGLIRSPELYKEYEIFSKGVFNDYFNIEKGINKLFKVYNRAEYFISKLDLLRLFTITLLYLLVGKYKILKSYFK